MASCKRVKSMSNGHWTQPWWDDYRSLLNRFDEPAVPAPEQLNQLLPPGAVSGGNRPLSFVPARSIPGVDYERHIFETGEVSTREDNRHDLFNALAWCSLPKLKASMNALHHAHLGEQHGGSRGPQRDALTLLDESGAIVISRERALLEALAARDWEQAFVRLHEAWAADTRVVICGHALLEKLLTPYQAITAHVLLIHIDSSSEYLCGKGLLARLDATLAAQLPRGLCPSPADLSPLPLMGIPGWWPPGEQDAAFYADRAVFRPPRAGSAPAPIRQLRAGPELRFA